MIIKIDGIAINVTDKDKNIVEIADENGIHIPAPCYRQEKRVGCCKGCAIKINDSIKYACCTKPEDNIEIEFKTKALIALRKKNIKEYADTGGSASGCCSSHNDSDRLGCYGDSEKDDASGCSCGDSCC